VVVSKSTGDWYNLERDPLEDSQGKLLDEVHWGTWLVTGGTIILGF
jgi:hypothetical protein